MTVEEFCANPWKTSHRMYDSSAFNIRPAPEFSTAEVAIASLYRSSGFSGHAESDVPKAGREFDRLSKASLARMDEVGTIKGDTWQNVLHGVLESPKQPNQSSKRFLSLSPVVPDVALYSGSARLAGNSWNPGALVQRMIQLGSASQVEAGMLWDRLFQALSVSDSDDVWARWLQGEFSRRRKLPQEWRKVELEDIAGIPDDEKSLLKYPAKQFVRDLDAIIQAKSNMTRRQWISLLEAIVRLASVTHVLWLCQVNDRLWRATAAILGQTEARIPISEDDVRESILMNDSRYLSYGKPAILTIKDYASRYLIARVGLNLVLWSLESHKIPVGKLQSTAELWAFLQLVEKHKERIATPDFLIALHGVYDNEARTISCKKGIGSNLSEFSRHTLGQRQTTNDSLRGYDQSYFLKKSSEARNAPWVLSLGPVAVLAVVHCCLRDASGPRSVKKLSDHLAAYGIGVDADNISSSDLGQELRMLGLVLDSPDAESGMLLVPPFGNAGQGAGA